MKKITAVMILLLLLLTVGCKSNTPKPADIAGKITSIAKNDSSVTFLVESGDGNASVTADSNTAIENGTLDELAVGFLVEVTYDGPVAESSPVQAKAARIVITGKSAADYVMAVPAGLPHDGLNIYRQTEYDFNGDGTPETITLYTSAGKDASGNFMMDDGQDWALYVEGSDGAFPLFERKFIQLGTLSYDLFFSFGDECAHVLVTSKQGAGIEITDYSYIKGRVGFLKTTAYTASNINLIG